MPSTNKRTTLLRYLTKTLRYLLVGAAVLVGAMTLIPGCFTPPIVLACAPRSAAKALKHYPKGTTLVELPVEGVGVLRGIYCPAPQVEGPGANEPAPVALHLMEGGGSPLDSGRHFGLVVGAYRLLGYSTLIIDYSGVALSDGTRSPKNLRRDSVAIFAEAVRRAGGDQQRVLVRATSLGTIGVAELLESGARPGALVLLSPVDPKNVASRGARVIFGSIASWFASSVLASASDADLYHGIRAAKGVPVLVVQASNDQFVTDEWREVMQMACLGEHCVERRILGSHAQMAGRSRDILVESELPFLLEEVELTRPRKDVSRRDVIAEIILRPSEGRSEEERAALIDTSDPSGPLPLDLLEGLALSERFSGSTSGTPWRNTVENEYWARSSYRCSWTSRIYGNAMVFELRSDHGAVYQQLIARGYAGAELRYVFARLLLKTSGVADRVVLDGAEVRLQQWRDTEWVPFELENKPAPIELPDSSTSSEPLTKPVAEPAAATDLPR